MMSILWAFIKKGFLTTFSYRLNSTLILLSMCIGVIQYAFMAKFLKEGNTFPLLAPYGGDLMAYLITGNIFMSFVAVSLNSFSETIRNEQMMGTLEYLLISKLSFSVVMINSSFWNFLLTCSNTVVIFALVILLFGMKLSINVAISLVILLISVICISGIGLMAAAVIMVTKRGDPITWVFSTLSGFLSGVIFPTEILPNFLRKVSLLLPPTYAVRALRKTVIVKASFSQVRVDILTLIMMAVITVSLGFFLFKWGLKISRREGTLTEY